MGWEILGTLGLLEKSFDVAGFKHGGLVLIGNQE
jgi:hypothetical protein